MKIGILIDQLRVGGVEKIAIQQVRNLNKQNVESILLVMRRRSDSPLSDLIHNVPVVFLDDRLPLFFRFSHRFPLFSFFSLFHISYAFFLPFVIKDKEYDHIIGHGTYTGFLLKNLRIMRHIPYSLFVWDPVCYILSKAYSHNMLSRITSFGKLIDKWIVGHAKILFVGGPAHNRYLNEIKPSKVLIVEAAPGVKIEKTISSKKRDYFLAVTAWKAGKYPEFLFRLLRKIPDLHFIVAGKWLNEDYQDWFVKQIKENGFSKQIHITGALTERKLRQYYKQALAVVQINDDRGFGMNALEAAACGTTFIIPRNQGVCKLFRNHKDGYFVGERNIKEIVSCIKKLKKKTNAIMMGKHAYRTSLSYSWENHVRKLLNNI